MGFENIFYVKCDLPTRNVIGLITVFDAILTSRQTRLEITVFVWKSDVK